MNAVVVAAVTLQWLVQIDYIQSINESLTLKSQRAADRISK